MDNRKKGSRLLTDTIREILHTKKRFLSLFVMSFLAVGFLAGLRMTAPDMQNTLDHYYDRQHFMDVRLISMLGLTEEDLEAVSNYPGVSKAEGDRSFDALAGEDSVTVLQLPEKLNLLDLIDGRLPESPDECVTEEKMLESLNLKIGDTITIDTRESFNSVLEEDPLVKNSAPANSGDAAVPGDSQSAPNPHSTKHSYKIVGIAHSPVYISRTRENSSVGNGSVNGFVVLPKDCFAREVYSQIYLELDGLSRYNCYRDDIYEEKVDAFIDEIKPFAKERAGIRREQVTHEATFTDMMAAVIQGIAESGSSGGSSGALSGMMVDSGEWYILGRDTIRSYVEFSEDSDRMSDLADVFPLIFFLVAALSSLTSMTRMVEDHRSEIGTLKALGFSTPAISIKYIGYALAGSLIGGGAGLLFGGIALPSLIYYEWGILYLLPKLEVGISPIVAAYSLGAAVLATAGAAFAACYATLRSKPAELLRPRAPKPGKRIFLEYIPVIWKHLSFIQKVSVRNLFRYKKRFWMTIVGIAGCTALLATGYGLRDSIFDVLTWQFDDLMPYNASVSISSDLTPSDRAELMRELEEEPGIRSFMGCYERSISVRTDEGTVDNVILQASSAWNVPAGDDPTPDDSTPADSTSDDSTSEVKSSVPGATDFHSVAQDYICLYPRADGLRRYRKIGDLPRLAPTNETIIIDEKMSDLLGIKEGDTVTLVDNEDKEFPVVVGGICENYVNHHIYMTSSYYKKVFSENPHDNLLLVKTVTDPADDLTSEVKSGEKASDSDSTSEVKSAREVDLSSEAIADRVSKLNGVITYSRIGELRDRFNESMQSLDIVVWIIIFAAAALAFLVLFNLTNINVTERLRELATLKVLGFYDGETASYVYRENIFLTLMGALAGLFMGKWLHRWLIGTIEMDYMIFGRGLHVKSYLYAVILTLIFSLSVNFFSYFYIRKIDMVESLKSVE